MDSTWSTNNDVDPTLLEFLNVFLNDGSTDASMDHDTHELSNGVHDERDLERKLSGWRHNQSLDVV